MAPGAAACVPQIREVVGTNHPAARGKGERLDDAGECDADKLGGEGSAQVHPSCRRDRKSGRRERGAGEVLAAGDPRGGRCVVRKPQGGGGAIRDLDGGVVGGDNGGDGPLAMRRDRSLDECRGVRKVDPDAAGESGDKRVLALARDQHLEIEVPGRLQVGVDPVASGRGDQQDPDRHWCPDNELTRSRCSRGPWIPASAE